MQGLDLVSEKSGRTISYWSKLLVSFSYTELPLIQGRVNKMRNSIEV